MPLIIELPKPKPTSNDPAAVVDWLVEAIGKIASYLRGLLILDADVRAQRTLVAERGVLFTGVSSAALISFETLIPQTVIEDYTTAAIAFDAASQAGRYRYDGGIPDAGAAPTSGMPIPAGAFQINLTGALNIRSFRAIGDGGNTLRLSVTLHK